MNGYARYILFTPIGSIIATNLTLTFQDQNQDEDIQLYLCYFYSIASTDYFFLVLSYLPENRIDNNPMLNISLFISFMVYVVLNNAVKQNFYLILLYHKCVLRRCFHYNSIYDSYFQSQIQIGADYYQLNRMNKLGM